MSNYLAIATVTAALQRTLQASIQRDVQGARISTVPPQSIGQGTPQTGINLFLYHVQHNNALKNSDATALRVRAKQTSKRQSALELYYILSFYGNDIELEPQRLLGGVVRTFSSQSILPANLIQETLADSTFTFLADSDLASQVHQIQIFPVDMSVEDLSKVWSVFVQAPYLLSVAYRVTAVIIDGEDLVPHVLPVRDPAVASVAPFPAQPQVERVIAQAGPRQPIEIASTLLIQGQNLKGLQTQIHISGAELTPSSVTETEIVLPLSASPAQLKAGVQSLQVVHRLTSGPTPGPAQRGVASNAAPFVLCPTVQNLQALNVHLEEELATATLHIEVTPAIEPAQSVIVSLYEWSVAEPASYLLDAPPRDSQTTTLQVNLPTIKRGTYLVRVVVDGAESLLEIDQNPNSPTFNWYDRPRVTIG